MSRRYIELYSGNRNRYQYPNPSSFEVPFAAVRKLLSPLQAIDPVLSGTIYYKWTGGYSITGALKANSTDSTLFLRPSSGTLSDVHNFYLGYHILLSNGEERNIKQYDPSTAGVSLTLAFNGIPTPAGTGTFTIKDPSTSSVIHIPAKDSNGLSILCYSQCYHNYYLIDETLSNGTNVVYRKIINYDFTTQLATLESPLPAGWSINDTYTLRQTVPFESWTLTVPPYGNLIYIPYDPSQRLENYVSKYVYNTSSPIDQTNGISTSFYILKAEFVEINHIVYLQLTLAMNGKPFPVVGNTINIIGFLRDNFVPLNYNGSVVSQNETVCYEITLISLTLPNSPLITGARVMFYPYVYVEFANISTPSGSSKDIIYSNNPQTNRALFIAPVTDASVPMNKGFVKIDAGAMTQTVKFKPNDGLRFSVYLPDGSLLQTVAVDYTSPYPPNNLVQVGAVFAIRRI
jgi:hypothetical protein